MLRPIDVIFKHPVKKFTVIYQNGKLWQLPKLEFDGQSLMYKKPYKGSREHIFVANDQTLDGTDTVLIAQLLTVHLPESMHNKNVNEFEHWWRQNWYGFREEIAVKKQRQQQAKQLLAAQHLAKGQNANPIPTAQAKSELEPQPQPQPSGMPQAKPVSSNSHDDFDDLLDDLLHEL